MKIGLISDTHGYMDKLIVDQLSDCDEIWHAGDIGDIKIIDTLEMVAPVRAVYGNIDDHQIRTEYPEFQMVGMGGKKFLMIHIAGKPGRYVQRARQLIEDLEPDVLICGHSHICRVLPDKKYNLLYINPGAAGNHGFHKIKTLITFKIENSRLSDMNVIELGRRGKIEN